MPSSACSATVRPKRASHAAGIGSSLTIVATPTPSAIAAPCASESTTSKVSGSSSWLSSITMPALIRYSVWPGLMPANCFETGAQKSTFRFADTGLDSRT